MPFPTLADLPEDAGAASPASSAQSARPPYSAPSSGPVSTGAAGSVDRSPLSSSRMTAPELAPVTTDRAPVASGQLSVNQALRDAWIYFLSPYRMQWFCTLTFRDSVHPERAMKLFRMWTNEINRSLYGKRWKDHGQGIYWILAWEYQKRGVLHFHALIGDVEDLNNRSRRLTWMDRWFDLAGIARIEDIENSDAVDRYITKYVLKDGQIDLSDTLKSFAHQTSLSNPKR